MGLFSKDIKSMDDLFIHQLQDIYYAEQQIEKNLPTMIEKARNPVLKSGFEQHLKETGTHIKRLESAFQMLGLEPDGTDCEAIDGILKEAKHVAGNVEDPDVLDAALLSSAQAVEHYEITRYGTLIAWAKRLAHDDVVPLFEQTIDEEKATDAKLTEIAINSVNAAA